jgi:hypothetical protein
MSKQVNIYNVGTDITAINCDIYFASVVIVSTSQPKLSVEFLQNKNINIANDESTLYIKQSKCFVTPFSKKPKIVINVPECVVPSLSVTAATLSLKVNGGIFSGVEVLADNGKVGLYDAAFDNVEVKGNKVLFLARAITVKSVLNSIITSGEILLENVFSKHTELNNKRGNVGAINLSCKDSSIESESGNISLTLDGARDDYFLTALSKGGTCNLDSDSDNQANKNTLKAYSAKGNIVIDFTQNKSVDLTEQEQSSDKED